MTILVPFDRVQRPIAQIVAAEQFTPLADIDDTRHRKVGQVETSHQFHN